jgi:hypothetical protein
MLWLISEATVVSVTCWFLVRRYVANPDEAWVLCMTGALAGFALDWMLMMDGAFVMLEVAMCIGAALLLRKYISP